MNAAGSLTIKNGRVLLPNGLIENCDVLIEGKQIKQVGTNIPSDGPTIDAGGSYVLPGLIDIHTHGMGHESTSEGSLKEYAKLCTSYGATTLYPTLFSSADRTVQQLKRHLAETNDLRDTPQVAGFRLESPYLAYTGGGTSKDLAPITDENTKMMLDAGAGHIKIWDISPELPGACDLIRQLTAQGIVASMAHTHATIDEAKAAVDAGLKLATHLFNTFVMPEWAEGGVYGVGLVDYLLIEDRVTCEIIGDGTHVKPILVEKAFRCKPNDGIVFVTDSNMGAGLPPGRYSLPGGWGDVMIDGSNNGVRLIDRDMGLAGSALTPIDGFRNAIRLFGADIARANHLCSTSPARLLGLNKGEIAVGKDADIIILNDDLELLRAIVQGAELFTK